MKLSVISLSRVLFEGDAKALTVKAVDGEITILDHHHPLVTLLSQCVAHITSHDGTRSKVPLDSGFLEVNYRNEVRVLIDE